MDLKDLIRWLRKNGYVLTVGGSNHYKVYRGDQLLCFMPASPRGGKRSMENVIAELRRAGVAIPRK